MTQFPNGFGRIPTYFLRGFFRLEREALMAHTSDVGREAPALLGNASGAGLLHYDEVPLSGSVNVEK